MPGTCAFSVVCFVIPQTIEHHTLRLRMRVDHMGEQHTSLHLALEPRIFRSFGPTCASAAPTVPAF